MSRIIVKNLPSKATESDVKAFFSPKGHITDVKVLRKRDGSSRRFAFVGFKTDSEAESAANYFNLSFMNSSRLQVALAKPLGDEELEMRKENLKRKRIANAEAADPKLADAKKKPVDSSNTKNKKDEKLDEFLKVMQPQKSTAMWKNDNTESAAPAPAAPRNDDDEDVNDMSKTAQPIDADSNVPQEDESENSNNENNDEEMQDTKPVAAAADDDEEEDWNPEANLDESEENEDKPALTDDEWLRQRQTRIKENGEKPKPPVEEENIEDFSDDENETNSNTNESEALADPQGAGVEPTNRLFVRNLAFSVSRIDLQELFGQFGELQQVHIPLDPKTDKSKGIAFVEFDEVSSSQEALEALDGKSFQGRLLHIIYATEQRNYQLDEFDIKQMPLKKQKALKRRMQASRQQFSWNSLYMNKDTVLEATAAKLNVSKSELLDPHSSNMAVQQALAESSVLENVQNYFKSKHVDLAKFQAGKSHDLSDDVILVKNLPFGVSALEIQDMFAQYGAVGRTLMPPDGGIAIVQYKLASDGRHAFKKLAFRRIGESILYLQKAPKGAVPDVDSSVSETKPATETGASAPAAAAEAGPAAADILLPGAQDPPAEDEADVRTSVFVKNLNFSTTLPSLIKLFQAVPGYISAVIKMKPDPKDSKKQHSMGFGFVEFRTLSQAQTAVKTLNNAELDGHKLQLKISTRGQDSASGASSKKKLASQGSTKIVIKNIPFETSKQDIVELFGTFGHLRSVRVPRKFNRQTRGFAFAEFATPKEAEHAMESLRGAHLLGRRLVMDYAEADAEDAEDEISRMEAKVSQQVNAVDTQSRRLGGQQKGFDMDEEQ